MTPKTLKIIKQRIAKFAKLYEALVLMWNGELVHGNNATYPVTVQVSIILQNLAFDGSQCINYSYDAAVTEMKLLIHTLEKINEYEDRCYMIHYAWNEVSSIYEGETMSEE